MTIRFGDFELDEGRRQLLRAGEPLRLSAKQFLLLKTLVEQRPNAVSKRELYDRLWPATYVSEVNLPTLIGELRNALEDDAHQPRFIRTVHGFGYAFCGDAGGVEPAVAESPVAYLAGTSCNLPLAEGENVIGRDPSLRCSIDDPSVSRRHAAIVCRGDQATLRDLHSKNGTYVGGVRVSTDRDLRDGEDVTLGSVRMLFRRTSPESTITLARDGSEEKPMKR
jgi:DNA-binding winged helix-turn-helix (wHTH) protein